MDDSDYVQGNSIQVCSYNKETSANYIVYITQLTVMHDVMYDVNV